MTSGWRRPALSFFRRKKTTEGHRYCTGTFYRLQISTTDLFTGTGTCTVLLYSTGYRYCPGAVLVLNCTGKKTPGEL